MNDALAPVRLLELLRDLRARQGSDLHLGPAEAPVMRVDGRLQRCGGGPLEAADIAAQCAVLFAENERGALHRVGHCDGAYVHQELGVFRVHAFQARSGTRLAVRALGPTPQGLAELGLPAVLATFAARHAGLVLLAGPAGCGKTTAAAALIAHINATADRMIVTIEDPIEYRHVPRRSVIAQRQVGTDTTTFAEALRGALREDPDVLFVGELRDPAAMAAALTAAETGHLVLATIHTNDAAQTIDRFVDAAPPQQARQVRLQIAQSLIGVVSLRLLARCDGAGRVAATEIMVGTEAVRSLILAGKTHQLRNAIMTGREHGMRTLESHLAELVETGRVDVQEARRHSDRPVEIPAAPRRSA